MPPSRTLKQTSAASSTDAGMREAAPKRSLVAKSKALALAMARVAATESCIPFSARQVTPATSSDRQRPGREVAGHEIELYEQQGLAVAEGFQKPPELAVARREDELPGSEKIVLDTC